MMLFLICSVKLTTYILFLMIPLFFISCEEESEQDDRTIIAKVGQDVLCLEDIASSLRDDLSPEDSPVAVRSVQTKLD